MAVFAAMLLLLLSGCAVDRPHASETETTGAVRVSSEERTPVVPPKVGNESTTHVSILYVGNTTALTIWKPSAEVSVPPRVDDQGHALWYWEYDIQANATISGANGTVWIRVPQAFVLASSIGLSVQKRGEATSYGHDYWNPQAPVIQPGDYRLEFSVNFPPDAPSMKVEQGAGIVISLYTNNAYVGAGSPFYVIAGGVNPSSFQFDGLAEPANLNG